MLTQAAPKHPKSLDKIGDFLTAIGAHNRCDSLTIGTDSTCPGLFASTLFTLFVIPVVYWLLYANTAGHGLPQSTLEE